MIRTDAPSPRVPASRAGVLLRIAKFAFVIVVLVAVGRYMWGLTDEWRKAREHGATLHWSAGWLITSGLLYVLGTACYPLFWRCLLSDTGLTANRFTAIRAYFVAGLGKFVPGKAWVVLIRAAMVPSAGVGRFTVGASVFYETFAMMATGGLVALVCLLPAEPRQWQYWLGGLGILVLMGGVLMPPVFTRVAKLAGLPFGGECQPGAPARWSRSTFRYGGWPMLGWLGLGLSLPAALAGMGEPCSTPGLLATSVGGVALATAAGFIVIFMPSGLGVREVVIVELLKPHYGSGKAVIASLLLRTIWTIGDVAAAGMVYWWRDRQVAVVPPLEGEPIISPPRDQ